MLAFPLRRIGLGLVAALALSPILWAVGAPTKAAPKTEDIDGKVVALASVLAKLGPKLDPDAAPQWLALVADDGKVYPLIKDDGSRMFFKDERLLNRPMRLTARLIPEVQMLQVIQVHSRIKGELHEVYYWCDICTIRGYEAGICDCCGGPMELRETPAR